MRDTTYATELVTSSIMLGDGSEARLERIHVKAEQAEELRFSWWKNGNIVMRPHDLSEEDLLRLMREALRRNVFSPQFIGQLRDSIANT